MLTVTAAIVEINGHILLAQRKKGALKGKWEFPGGKLEVGETPEQCLAREMMEEFGVLVEVNDFVCSSIFSYRHGTIKLLAYRVTHQSGEFVLHDHNAIQWVTPEELRTYDLSDADIPIAQKLWEQAASKSQSR